MTISKTLAKVLLVLFVLLALFRLIGFFKNPNLVSIDDWLNVGIIFMFFVAAWRMYGIIKKPEN